MTDGEQLAGSRDVWRRCAAHCSGSRAEKQGPNPGNMNTSIPSAQWLGSERAQPRPKDTHHCQQREHRHLRCQAGSRLEEASAQPAPRRQQQQAEVQAAVGQLMQGDWMLEQGV